MPDAEFGGGNFNSGLGSAARSGTMSAGNMAGSAGRDGGGLTGGQAGGGGMSGNAMSGNGGGRIGNGGSGGLGNSTREGGFGASAGGGALNSAFGTGFRGPASTWGSNNSVVPGSALDRATFNSQSINPSPMSPYGDEFNFTPDEMTNAFISEAPFFRTPTNPSLFDLQDMGEAISGSTELQSMLGAINAPFASTSAVPSPGVPTVNRQGMMDALGASMPSYTPSMPTSQPYQHSAEAVGLPAATGMLPAMQKAGYVTSYPSEGEVDAWKASLGPNSTALNIETPTDPISFESTPQLRAMKDAMDLAAYQQARPITATETLRPYVQGNTTNHPDGLAVDFSLSNPVTGQHLQNIAKMTPSGPVGKSYRGAYGAVDPSAFGQYEAVAQDVYKNLQNSTDDSVSAMANDFRWGGYFSPSGTEMDMMHIDLNGAKFAGDGMGAGDFATGLTPSQKQRWAGVDSYGMGQQPTRVAAAPSAPAGFSAPVTSGAAPPTRVAATPGPTQISPPGLTSTIPMPRPTPRPTQVSTISAPPAPAAAPPKRMPGWADAGVSTLVDLGLAATPMGLPNLFSKIMGGPTLGTGAAAALNGAVYGSPPTGTRPEPTYATNFNNGSPSAAPSSAPPVSPRTPSWSRPQYAGGNGDGRGNRANGSQMTRPGYASAPPPITGPMTQPGFGTAPITIASSDTDASVAEYMRRYSSDPANAYTYGLRPQETFYS